jgi:hypothetical protein
MHRLFLAFLFFAQSAPPQHPLPPPGITLSPKDQHDLRAELDRLTQRLNNLRENPHAPDIIIFEKAVRYALDGNEFLTQADVFRAKELLRTGLERADALTKGDAPWSRATGLSIRGYVSQIDHNVQPYGLVVPPSYAPDRLHRLRVDAWFHGRSETLSEVNYLWDRLHNAGQFAPLNTIVLHLYGRCCNARTFASELDLLSADR